MGEKKGKGWKKEDTEVREDTEAASGALGIQGGEGTHKKHTMRQVLNHRSFVGSAEVGEERNVSLRRIRMCNGLRGSKDHCQGWWEGGSRQGEGDVGKGKLEVG